MDNETEAIFLRPFRVIGSDGLEVAMARFTNKDGADNLAKKMTGLQENWDRTDCHPPYRVQELVWKDV